MNVPEEIVGRWKVRRYVPKKRKLHGEYPVAHILYLHIYKREVGVEITLAKLTPVMCVKVRNKSAPVVLPMDRAIAWEELISWVKHLAIFPDHAVQEGQFQNRMEWESWAHAASERPPDPANLYDWQKDESMLARVRPSYQQLATRLTELIGAPQRSDFDCLYPNTYDDEGLSDKARQAIRDLKILFGREIVQ